MRCYRGVIDSSDSFIALPSDWIIRNNLSHYQVNTETFVIKSGALINILHLRVSALPCYNPSVSVNVVVLRFLVRYGVRSRIIQRTAIKPPTK